MSPSEIKLSSSEIKLNVQVEPSGEYTICELTSHLLGDGTVHVAISRKANRALGYALRELAQALIDSGR